MDRVHYLRQGREMHFSEWYFSSPTFLSAPPPLSLFYTCLLKYNFFVIHNHIKKQKKITIIMMIT